MANNKEIGSLHTLHYWKIEGNFNMRKLGLLIIGLVLLSLPALAYTQQIYVAPDPEALLKGESGDVGEYLAGVEDARRARWMLDSFKEYYYFRRQVQFDVEMLLREKYLLGLFTSINAELANRKNQALSTSVFDVDFVIDSTLLVKPELDSTAMMSLAQSYEPLRDYHLSEHHQKLIFAEALKTNLVANGTDFEVRRMFDYDLEMAYNAYMAGDYTLAILYFTHIEKLYSYANLDDIVYYRGEAEYGAGYMLSAIETFRDLLDNYPESNYRIYALSRLYYIYTLLDDPESAKNLWTEFDVSQFNLNIISEFDQRWKEVADSIEVEGIDKKERKRLTEVLSELENNVPYTEEMVDQASRLFYSAGLALYLGGYYTEAHEALSQVPEYTPNEFKAAFLDGDILMRMEDFSTAVEPLEFIANTRFYEDEPEYQLAEESLIKLGYTYFQLSRFEESRSAFLSVDAESEQFPYALMGMAWVEFKLNHFTYVDSVTSILISEYPDHPLLYEATALSGFNRELLGRRSEAIGSYQNMLEILSNLTDIRKFISERRIIIQRLREMKAMESEIIVNDDTDMFLEYLDLSETLNRLYQRVKLAEMVELNSKMGEYLMERDSVRTIIEEHYSMQDTVSLDAYKSLEGMYRKIEGRLQQLSAMIQVSGYAYAKHENVAQQAAEIRYENEVTDTLLTHIGKDLEKVNKSLEEVREARESVEYADAPDGPWVDLDIVEAQLSEIERTHEKNILSLSEGRMREVTVDINKWRDFAFTRYALADMDFDYLLEQMNLLTNISENITTIDLMIDQKQKEAEENAAKGMTTAPPVELEPEVEDGDSLEGTGMEELPDNTQGEPEEETEE